MLFFVCINMNIEKFKMFIQMFSSMGSSFSSSLLCFLLVIISVCGALASDHSEVGFDQNFGAVWAKDHIAYLDQGREIQLSLDNFTGSGFGSKLEYGSGFFSMRIKVPGRNSAGVVTAYYLHSSNGRHDELDFEFLGNKEGKPIRLQTNVYANGKGDREQRIYLWFDPTKDFHTYRILWNEHQVVFWVDEVPIRVFKNNTNIGVAYPSVPMYLYATIWDGDGWATDGGLTKINWTFAPFQAQFQGFNIDGCPSNNGPCFSTKYWWNRQKFWTLDTKHQNFYENVKKKYMYYDYCTDKKNHPKTPPECFNN